MITLAKIQHFVEDFREISADIGLSLGCLHSYDYFLQCQKTNRDH